MADIEIYNPDSLGAPLGQYCHVARVKASEFLFIAGSLSADKEGNVSDFSSVNSDLLSKINRSTTNRYRLSGNIVS